MAFEQEPTRIPVEIGNITVILIDGFDEGSNPFQKARFEIKIKLSSDGAIITRRGDLGPHITAAQRQALIGFMTGLRAQAETEMLP